MDPDAIEQIIAQYHKHGWQLRQVILSDPLRSTLADKLQIFGDTNVKDSEIDAVWFSRRSRPGVTAWELRHLSNAPFALVIGVDDNLTPEEGEKARISAEARMKDALYSRRTSD